MSLTQAQQQAIAARGNVVLVAGAGTGKTSTLVERCLHCLETHPRASLDEILMVTFTDAAAAEMRQRIRDRLLRKRSEDPGDPHREEQLALFETAHIGTLHSFCLQLVRQHFYELGLDPQLSVVPEEEGRVLAEETLDKLLEGHFAGKSAGSNAVLQLIENYAKGSDKPIRSLVLRLHNYAQTLPDPSGWLQDQVALLDESAPSAWSSCLIPAVAQFRDLWLETLSVQSAENSFAAGCAAILKELPPSKDVQTHAPRPPTPAERTAAADILSSLVTFDETYQFPSKKKTAMREPIEKLFDEAAFLLSVSKMNGATDPIAEDWNWVRPQMQALLQLAGEFTVAFTDAKRELGVVDFHDIEQYALKLLWDPKAKQPTPSALDWRHRLRFVFVDEYQDINKAQDTIIEALSRGGNESNRFLVGDVKQSIYRFRLANPLIFQRYVEQWHGDRGQAIPLSDNFRSREGILDFVNSLFAEIMRREIGGVSYDAQARLVFGAPAARAPLSRQAGSPPRVELHLRFKGETDNEEWDEETASAMAAVLDLQEADKEARLVALRLLELKSSAHNIWDRDRQVFRPVEWRDMAVLLRSPSRKAESYAKEFEKLGVNLQVERGGFYDSQEITDLVSLLHILDNPLQDIPVLAVLRSPIVGLSLDELATIRLSATKVQMWTALRRWHESQAGKGAAATASNQPAGNGTPAQETLRKVSLFLERFARWRQMARQMSLSHCLEAVLLDTRYDAWLLTREGGVQAAANVHRLASLAQQFDQFQRQGLSRFLRFIEAQQLAETEPEVSTAGDENAVRLMSIHQSKGLEFPVVVLADLAKPFNLEDLRAEIILDDDCGICPRVKPPHTGQHYPSLPHWIAHRSQRRELLGEELRLLYVAMTRARDTLVLVGSLSRNEFDKRWLQSTPITIPSLLSARSYAQWIGAWFSAHAHSADAPSTGGKNELLSWQFHDETKLLERPPQAAPEETPASQTPATPALLEKLQLRLGWQYPFIAATRQPAKTSVSALRRRAAMDAEESTPYSAANKVNLKFNTPSQPGKLSATDIGTAHHAFLQRVSLDQTGELASLQAEARRMEQAGALSPEELAALDFDALLAFWNSDEGREIRKHSQHVRRELAFTARFTPAELAQFTGQSIEPGLQPDPAEDFVVVQGVADLAVLLPGEIWLLDFKTDRVQKDALADKVKSYEPQLRLYGSALSRIYKRPVTRCWLYFLTARNAVLVPGGAPCDHPFSGGTITPGNRR